MENGGSSLPLTDEFGRQDRTDEGSKEPATFCERCQRFLQCTLEPDVCLSTGLVMCVHIRNDGTENEIRTVFYICMSCTLLVLRLWIVFVILDIYCRSYALIQRPFEKTMVCPQLFWMATTLQRLLFGNGLPEVANERVSWSLDAFVSKGNSIVFLGPPTYW